MNTKTIAINRPTVTRRNLFAESAAQANQIQLPISPADPRPVLIVTDAWNQINGVFTDMLNLRKGLSELGYNVEVIHPDLFKTMRSPDPSFRLAVGWGNFSKIKKMIAQSKPQSVFIATEGPLGIMAKSYCEKYGIPYTTHYATKFPEFVDARLRDQIHLMHQLFKLPEDAVINMTYDWLKHFHSGSALIVKTASVMEDLKARGFKNPVLWGASVDTDRFHPSKRVEGFVPVSLNPDWKGNPVPGPVLVYMGRVEKEKNLDAFLTLDLQKDIGLPPGTGTKMVIGGGQDLERLMAAHPDVLFTGPKLGDELVTNLAYGNVFVFPSLTDTLGLVLLEAGSLGLPFAGFNVTGPKDVYALAGGEKAGVIDDNLAVAIKGALKLNPEDTRPFVLQHFSNVENSRRMAGLLYGVPETAYAAPPRRHSAVWPFHG